MGVRLGTGGDGVNRQASGAIGGQVPRSYSVQVIPYRDRPHGPLLRS